MKRNSVLRIISGSLALAIALCGGIAALGQTTAFTYQGKLTHAGVPPTATYDVQFALFDAATGGSPIATITNPSVAVTNGIFTVQLDYGSAALAGQDRWIEISIRPAGDTGSYQQLLPRQPITSAPYAIQALNAETAMTATLADDSSHLGGVAANQFVLTNDARLSDARSPLAGSTNYIQNRSTTQASAGFNIDGTGRADTFSATTEYDLGGNRVLSVAGTNNLFAGINAGKVNTTGSENSFFGRGAGVANTTGHANSFFGYQAGNGNVGGVSNSFFGYQAGNKISNSTENTFIGDSAGANSTTDYNTFIGSQAGIVNTIGNYNTFVGISSGGENTIGPANTFIGGGAGNGSKSGDHNSAIGFNAHFGSDNLVFATAIGSLSRVDTSNTIVLGQPEGSDTVYVPGKLHIGTLATAGNTQLCLNASNRVGTCSSSLRYKTNLAPYRSGLEIITRLRPITFDWKDGGMHDLGFGAEDVAKVDPLLVTHNAAGEIEGVKYDRISAALVNAVQEQQQQIESLQKQLRVQRMIVNRQQLAIDKLTRSVHPTSRKSRSARGRRL